MTRDDQWSFLRQALMSQLAAAHETLEAAGNVYLAGRSQAELDAADAAADKALVLLSWVGHLMCRANPPPKQDLARCMVWAIQEGQRVQGLSDQMPDGPLVKH